MIENFISFLSAHFHYNTHGVLNLTAGFFNISVGLIVLLNNPRNRVNRSFFLLTLATSIWVFSFGLQNLVNSNEAAFLCQSLAYSGGIPFIPTFFYLFVTTWVRGKINNLTLWTWVGWSAIAMTLMVFFTYPLVGITSYPWGKFPYFRTTPIGLLYACFLLIPFFINAVLTFRAIFQGLKTAISPRERVQFRNFLIGYVIAYLGAIDFIAAFRIPIYPAGYIFLTIFIGIVAYSIARHQIFEINILVRKFAAIFLIYVLLFALFLPLSSILLGGLDPHLWPRIMGVSALFGLSISMGPLIYATLTRHTYWLRGQSAAGLTHELKSPLGAIQSAVEVLLTHHTTATPAKEKTFDYLHMIEKNAQRLEVFINDLLKLAKIQNEDIVLEKKQADLSQVVREGVDFYKVSAEKKGLTIVIQPTMAHLIEIDRSRLQQVISNLLSNAIKFSERGEIIIKLEKKGETVICSIRDPGIGIPKSDLEKIFNRFYQGKHTAKGSGIGLTIAKAWVEAHGGKIWAESEGEGKGTTVTFTLPV